MSRFEFRLPDVGEGVARAEITTWHVAVGDTVQEEQSIVDVMTDKVTMDVASPVAGVVVSIHGAVGNSVSVGSPLIVFETDATQDVAAPRSGVGTEMTASPTVERADARSESGQAEVERPEAHLQSSSTETSVSKVQPLASPFVRARAHELGIPLQYVAGTGPGGRVLLDDLNGHVRGGMPVAPRSSNDVRRTVIRQVKIVGLRRKIAERMEEAKRRIPHFSYVEECDLTTLEALRRELNADRVPGQPKLTLLPFMMRALARALPDFPSVNARFDDDAGVLDIHDGVHVGIATQTPGGLVVPVVRHVEALSLWDCARELLRVTSAARDGSASREELGGSTITLTSLGALGGVSATPVINRPEVAIVGPNKLMDRPVVVDGAVVIRTMINLSSSFDHRIVDGHEAARFVQALKKLLEKPALLFLDRP